MGLPCRKTDAADKRPDIAIGHIGLRVQKFAKSLAFFKLVGVRVVVHMPGMAILELRGGTHLILRQDQQAEDTDAGFDLMTDDIDEMRDRLVSADFAPTEIVRGGVHRSFDVTDPSGIRIEFTSSHAVGDV